MAAYLVIDLIKAAILLSELIDSRDEALTDEHQLVSRGLDELNTLLRLSYENKIVPGNINYETDPVPQYDSYYEEIKGLPEYYLEFLRYGLAERLCDIDAIKLPDKKKGDLADKRSNVQAHYLSNFTIG